MRVLSKTISLWLVWDAFSYNNHTIKQTRITVHTLLGITTCYLPNPYI